MEVSIPIENINVQNVYFGEKKKNMVVDGDFTKIIYSTESFEMSGMSIHIQFIEDPVHFRNDVWNRTFTDVKHDCEDLEINDASGFSFSQKDLRRKRTTNKRMFVLTLDKPNLLSNFQIVERLCQIEYEILHRYIEHNCPRKPASYLLKTQLMSGIIKHSLECKSVKTSDVSTKMFLNDDFTESIFPKTFVLKISGIWETSHNVGITMKFISIY